MNNFNANKEKTIKTAIGIILSVVITVTLAVILIALVSAKFDANAKPVSSEDSEIYKVIDEFSIDRFTSIITVFDTDTGDQYMVVTYTRGRSSSVAITPRIRNE